MGITTMLLQAAQPGGSMMPIFLMVGMFVVMYFFMIRPQNQKAKEQKKFADSMNSGEYVITTAGIHGTINRANEDGTLQLEVGRGNFMKIERSAVSMELTAAYRKKNSSPTATPPAVTSAKN
jgi:preprotein translocase subunit YajC